MPDYGVPGRTARHTWTSERGRVFVLNDAERDLLQGPRAVCEEADLHGGADIELASDDATGRHGEIPRRSGAGGKTVPYAGDLEALSFLELSRMRRDFLAAFVEGQRGTMVVSPDPAAPGGVSKSFTYDARVLTRSVTEKDDSEEWRWPFLLSLRMHDRRFFDTVERSVLTAPTTDVIVNEVADPFFEGGVAWTGGTAGGGVLASRAIAQDAAEGRVMRQVVTNPTGQTALAQNRASQYQTVAPGDTVGFRIRVRLDAPATATLVATVQWSDGAGTLLSETEFGRVTNAQAGAWQEFAATLVAPAGAVRASVALYNQHGAVAESSMTVAALGVRRGAALPFIFDGDAQKAAWTGVPYASRSVWTDSAISLVSDGTTPTEPIVELPGPKVAGARVGIQSDSLGNARLLMKPGTALDAGDKLIVDFAKRRITRASGAEVTGALDRPMSDWWDAFVDGLRDGANDLRALGLAAGGQATVRWRDAYLG